jgi:hypothetical protein
MRGPDSQDTGAVNGIPQLPKFPTLLAIRNNAKLLKLVEPRAQGRLLDRAKNVSSCVRKVIPTLRHADRAILTADASEASLPTSHEITDTAFVKEWSAPGRHAFHVTTIRCRPDDVANGRAY